MAGAVMDEEGGSNLQQCSGGSSLPCLLLLFVQHQTQLHAQYTTQPICTDSCASEWRKVYWGRGLFQIECPIKGRRARGRRLRPQRRPPGGALPSPPPPQASRRWTPTTRSLTSWPRWCSPQPRTGYQGNESESSLANGIQFKSFSVANLKQLPRNISCWNKWTVSLWRNTVIWTRSQKTYQSKSILVASIKN